MEDIQQGTEDQNDIEEEGHVCSKMAWTNQIQPKSSMELVEKGTCGQNDHLFLADSQRNGKGSAQGSPASRPRSSNSQIIRKSAWERAHDKYKAQQEEQKKATKVAPLLTDDVIVSVRSFPDIKNILAVFRSKHFNDGQLEWLFQRYFFKLNQNNLTILMALFSVICVLLILFYYLGGATLPARGVNLGIVLVTFFILEIVCNRGAFDQQQMMIMCYVILTLLVGIVLLTCLDSEPHSASDSVWNTLIFIYMLYTLLPIRMRLAVISGFGLSVLHIICSIGKNVADTFLWKQVREVHVAY